MPKLKSISLVHSFHFRVALAIVAAMMFVCTLGGYFILKYTLDSQFEAIRTRLMVIAQTAAPRSSGATITKAAETSRLVVAPATIIGRDRNY